MRICSAPGHFCVTLCLPFLGTSCEWTHLSFCVWLVLLSVMFSGFILVAACMRIPFFLLNRILLSADSMCLPFQLSAYPWLASAFWLLWICCEEHGYAHSCLSLCSQFLWVHTQEWNFLVLWEFYVYLFLDNIFEMWGFRKLCILNSCVWARILAQHWSWVVQPCPGPLGRWQLSGNALRSGEVWNPPAHALWPRSLWRWNHVCTRPSLPRCEQNITHDPWSPEPQKQNQFPDSEGDSKIQPSSPWIKERLLDSGFPWSCCPVTALFCFAYFSGFSLDQKSCY